MASTGCATNRDASAERDRRVVDDGYTTYDAEDDVGATAVVETDDILSEPESLADLLRGRVSGVEVREAAGGISVRIRGTQSLIGSNEPLYVVDGVSLAPRPGGVLGIHPNDIKRVTVLKGPEASLYGSRGANGVIVITTKRGGE